MNDLQYAGTHQGNTILYFPHAGHEFWFEKVDHRTVTLMRVIPVDSVEQVWDKTSNHEDLPKKVRAILRQNNFRYRPSVSSASEAMV
ncbi:hypothetical protein [Natrinema sp. H-ect4]|uniref:hypothetical protein n=1 Tax=Natrinema sp. H-ect4 TaxID=3242699 RepID=UPI0035A86EE7